MRYKLLLACVTALVPQIACAAALPTKLTGVIIFTCVTTQRGVKIDQETYKVDFSRSQVNNEPVEMHVDDLKIRWEPKKSVTSNKGGSLTFDKWIWRSIDRFNGKLDSEINGSGLTICHISGRRKF